MSSRTNPVSARNHTRPAIGMKLSGSSNSWNCSWSWLMITLVFPLFKANKSFWEAGSNSVAVVTCVNRYLICLSVLVKASFSEVKSVGRMPLSPMCLFMVSVLCLMLWIA